MIGVLVRKVTREIPVRVIGGEKCHFIYKSIRYLIWVKGGITHVFSYNFAKLKTHSYNSLPLEKTLTFHNVIIHIKSVCNEDKDRYYYNTFLEKCSYQLPKNCNNT